MKVIWKEHMICNHAKKASSFLERSVGLMFCSEMKGFDGLLIRPCNSIHTFFMRYEIDVLFLNDENKVVKIIRQMKPWRLSSICWKSRQVLELKGGTLPKDIGIGERLEIKCIS